jgi:hypothetical protein
MVYCPEMRGDVGAGTFVTILYDNKTYDGLIVVCSNSLLEIPTEERGGGALETDNKGCGWTKVIIMVSTLEGGIESNAKFVPLRKPEVMHMKECVMTLEFCWVRSDAVLDFLWVFPPTDAASANGMTSARVLRYRLKNSTVLQEIPEDSMYFAFPSMYSQYQSMYDDCYPARLYYSLTSIRKRFSMILNRVTQSQGGDFCSNKHTPVITMSPDCWSYINRYLLKAGIYLEDYQSKRVFGELHGTDMSYHAVRQTLKWSRFTIDTESGLSSLQGLLGAYIWVGTRKKRPKVDTPASNLSINDVWNVVNVKPDSIIETPLGVVYGKYDLLYAKNTRALKVWIEYRRRSTGIHGTPPRAT